jgi:hypothetical protein
VKVYTKAASASLEIVREAILLEREALSIRFRLKGRDEFDMETLIMFTGLQKAIDKVNRSNPGRFWIKGVTINT